MVEDVERLHCSLHGKALRDLCFFREREIHLPAVEGADHSVWGIAKTGKVPAAVDRRSLERGGVNQGHVVMSTAGQCQGHSGDEVWSLAGLIVTIGEKVGLRPTEVHPHG